MSDTITIENIIHGWNEGGHNEVDILSQDEVDALLSYSVKTDTLPDMYKQKKELLIKKIDRLELANNIGKSLIKINVIIKIFDLVEGL